MRTSSLGHPASLVHHNAIRRFSLYLFFVVFVLSLIYLHILYLLDLIDHHFFCHFSNFTCFLLLPITFLFIPFPLLQHRDAQFYIMGDPEGTRDGSTHPTATGWRTGLGS